VQNVRSVVLRSVFQVCVEAAYVRFIAVVSVLVGPCCPALLNCIDVDVHTVVLLCK